VFNEEAHKIGQSLRDPHRAPGSGVFTLGAPKQVEFEVRVVF